MDFDQLLETAPEASAVFAIFAEQGQPYLAKTTQLRRRLRRLLGANARVFSLREVARRVEYVTTASRLEASILHYQWAKRYFGESWQKRLRLRWPSYVKLILSNEFPRTQVTTRLTGQAAFYGPFLTRAMAEAFESQLLDLYQVRRCSEDLAPSPQHPGCIYGEMNLCLRPCQMAVSSDEYRSEVERLRGFLHTDGGGLRTSIVTARDRASDALEFEEAQRQQKHLEKLDQVLKLRDDLAHDVATLGGVAVLPSVQPGHVRLWRFAAGCWQPPIDFPLATPGVSMDSRLREVLTAAEPESATVEERQEHIAILTHWFHSSFRDGDWIAEPISYRKLVRAINSVAQSQAKSSSPPEGS